MADSQKHDKSGNLAKINKPKGILMKPDTPKRIKDEAKNPRRLSWGKKKMKEFHEIMDSNSLDKGKRKSNTRWGPEVSMIITPPQEELKSNKVDVDIEDDDSINLNLNDMNITTEERKRILDEMNDNSLYYTKDRDTHEEEKKNSIPSHNRNQGNNYHQKRPNEDVSFIDFIIYSI